MKREISGLAICPVRASRPCYLLLRVGYADWSIGSVSAAVGAGELE